MVNHDLVVISLCHAPELLNYKLNEFSLLTSDLNINNNKIINVSNPVNNNDVSNKNYVDLTVNNSNLDIIIAGSKNGIIFNTKGKITSTTDFLLGEN